MLSTDCIGRCPSAEPLQTAGVLIYNTAEVIMSTKTKPPLPPVRRLQHCNDRKTEMQWLREHGLEYPGEYIALDGNRLIAHSLNADEVFAEVRRSGVTDPLFAHLEQANRQPELGGW